MSAPVVKYRYRQPKNASRIGRVANERAEWKKLPDTVAYFIIKQGRRKHFKIGQAIIFFFARSDQIFLAPPPLARLLYGLQMLHGF